MLTALFSTALSTSYDTEYTMWKWVIMGGIGSIIVFYAIVRIANILATRKTESIVSAMPVDDNTDDSVNANDGQSPKTDKKPNS